MVIHPGADEIMQLGRGQGEAQHAGRQARDGGDGQLAAARLMADALDGVAGGG